VTITHEAVIGQMQDLQAVVGGVTSDLEAYTETATAMADNLVRTAEAISKYGVSPATQAEMADLAALAKQAAAQIIAVTAHGQDAARVAHIGVETAMREHSGIQEAFTAYTDAATDGSWYTQE
jgi:hypothetical protein